MAPSKRAGATSQAVANNLLVLRGSTGMSLRQLSGELAERGVTISAQSLSALEKGSTAVTVDLLTALAAVFGVSPIRLLVPESHDGFDPEVALTGTDSTYPISLYEWLAGTSPLGMSEHISEVDPRVVTAFRERSQPAWMRRYR
ncbi:helix-turn-helix domain-containing protein [Mycobacteroides abscessus]|uniref:helix-turn-helix domain-containing protein n=1 Tax=Mycobacteroides abscessus TaxID=36809 RepID=UPI001F3A3C63|nr:helix-turn-helix transcriptional regulator [Mycobacteroides abscessus]MDM2175288.1 helix-turn-helix transcriptional regulator [Mycobacteroides abscessus]MDM2176326.1 helix-turn-helix transcriptional regulator [Mycobacteroides abscessus]MDM2204891.1 helix-turn-helix transcriptional regulator [Mycobacteroides abscessus]MDM2210476.1 helix-turn-helix transcriptional regulator [Mycobacteroides abscessus]MDM2215810.1 helix-turn-helix transcriptional regulator [Mycobacteroides abscessus]